MNGLSCAIAKARNHTLEQEWRYKPQLGMLLYKSNSSKVGIYYICDNQHMWVGTGREIPINETADDS